MLSRVSKVREVTHHARVRNCKKNISLQVMKRFYSFVSFWNDHEAKLY